MMGALFENNNAETAALVVVANAMMNLDEWVNKKLNLNDSKRIA